VMPKSRQTKKPKCLTQSKRLTSTVIAVGGGGYLKNMWLLEVMVTQLEAMEPDWEKNSAIRRQWWDPYRPGYVEEVGHADDLMIDVTLAACAEGRVPAHLVGVIRKFGDDATMSPERVEKLLASLARAGVIAWEPGATSIKLRPCKRRNEISQMRMSA
jgi:hypothetical protein